MQKILNHPDLIILNNLFSSKFNDFELRLVGGCVRDIMLGVEPKDIDLATNATPDEMIMMANECGFDNLYVIPTGLQHGTVTFVVNGNPYEITTLRIDRETDGRHAQVEFTRDWKIDAERRDLTINSMSMDFNGYIYDYFSGALDLNLNRVRFVGDAEHRIKEDYLRILRYFRFAARFDSAMDSKDLNTIYRNQEGLQTISRERIWMEMSKLVTYKCAHSVLRVMEVYGVLQQIGLPATDPRIDNVHTIEGKMASFFINNPKEALTFCNNWKNVYRRD